MYTIRVGSKYKQIEIFPNILSSQWARHVLRSLDVNYATFIKLLLLKINESSH